MPQKEYHTGVVTDVQDPEKRGRICVSCPDLLSNDNLEWLEPTFGFVDSSQTAGFFAVPNTGSQVEIEIDAEPDAEVNGLNPKWRCSIYPNNTVPAVFEENYPNRRGIVTAAGHVMYFDDTNGSCTLQYTHPSGAEIYVDNDGVVVIHTSGSNTIRLGSSGATEHALLGDVFTDHLDDLVTAIQTYANDPAVQEVPGVMTACVALATACLTFLVLHATHLSDKVVLE